MEQRSNGGVAALLVLLMLVSIPIPVAGDVVIRSEVVDLFPSGTFDNSSEWALSTQYGFTPEVQAHWTESMIIIYLLLIKDLKMLPKILVGHYIRPQAVICLWESPMAVTVGAKDLK